MSAKIKWGSKEYTINKSENAIQLKWTAKLENDKINIYNSKNKLIKTYETNNL